MIDRDRFFVTHKQQVVGNITDLVLELRLLRHGEPLCGRNCR